MEHIWKPHFSTAKPGGTRSFGVTRHGYIPETHIAVPPTHLHKRDHNEPSASLGVVNEYRLKPDPEPVALSGDVAIRRLNCLPLPLVCPGKEAVVLGPAALETGQEAT